MFEKVPWCKRYVWLLVLYAALIGNSNGGQRNACANFGTCSQLCTSNNKGLNCSCIEGFKLGRNGKSCSLIDKNWKLIYSQRKFGSHFISQINNLGERSAVLHTAGIPYGVTCDARNNVVYWVQNHTVYRCGLHEGSTAEVIANTGILETRHIAFDWITGNIYILDSNYPSVVVCRNDSSACSVILEDVFKNPRGLALHPNMGFMFVTDWDSNSSAIFRAGMDGSYASRIISTDLLLPEKISVDQGNGRIYWIDSPTNKIESSRFDGSDRRIILSSDLTYMMSSLDVFGDNIIWKGFRGDIWRMDKFNELRNKLLFKMQNDGIIDIVLCHVANQPILGSSPCNESACSHICTIGPSNHFKCLCPEEMQLGTDNNTCFDPNNPTEVVVATENVTRFIDIHGFWKQEPSDNETQNKSDFMISKFKSISVIVYNPINHTLIISDKESKKIYEYHPLNKWLSVRAQGFSDAVECLDIDVVGENLYWVNSDKKTIEAMSLQTGARILISSIPEIFYDILVVPEQSAIYAAAQMQKGEHVIHKMDLNGFNMSIVERILASEPIFIFYDREHDNVLWKNKTREVFTVESLTLNEIEETTLVTHPSNIATATYGRFIYYADVSSPDSEVVLMNGSLYHYKLRIMQWINVARNRTGAISEAKFTIINPELSILEDLRSRHDCGVNNPNKKNCTHACLLTGDPFIGVCGCPEGMILANDGCSCVRSPSCQQDEYICKTGHCISKTYNCDGKAKYFKCADSGFCIPEQWVCDNENDCVGGDDEVNCTVSATTNIELKFTCERKKQCIPKSQKCNGTVSCQDDISDEWNCVNNTVCSHNRFICIDSRFMDQRMKCDGVPKCSQGEDADMYGEIEV